MILKELPRVESGADRVCGRTLRREFQDAGAVWVKPQLSDDPAAGVVRSSERQLQDEDGPEDAKVVEFDPLRVRVR